MAHWKTAHTSGNNFAHNRGSPELLGHMLPNHRPIRLRKDGQAGFVVLQCSDNNFEHHRMRRPMPSIELGISCDDKIYLV